MIEELHQITKIIAFGLELTAAFVIAVGGLHAITQIVRVFLKKLLNHQSHREIWLGFARWILLGLEFMMAADIVGTIVSPTWESVGLLASIALIRTFLSYFLERDLDIAKNTSQKGDIP